MRRKLTVMIAVAVCALIVGIGSTFAYIIAVTSPLENTFTVGNIEISLTESTGTSYQIIPGTSVKKDPRVTVNSGSEACWLFVKLEKSADFDTYLSYSVADGWTALDGQVGVYYRELPVTTSNVSFGVILNDTVTVKDTVTEAQLDAITVSPDLRLTAYAVQREGVNDVALAWQEIEALS